MSSPNVVKGPLAVSPKGVFKYAYLNTPDDYQGKKQYKCNIICDKDDPAFLSLVEKCDAFEEVACATLKKKSLPKRPWEDVEDDDSKVMIKFTSSSDKYPPELKDAGGQGTIPRTTPIFGGTVGRLKSNMVAYPSFGGGISFSRLSGAQVIEMSERSSGFDAEDGYVAPDEVEEVADIQDQVQDTVDVADSGDTDEPNF